jgi:hypothetical protein
MPVEIEANPTVPMIVCGVVAIEISGFEEHSSPFSDIVTIPCDALYWYSQLDREN